MKTIISLIFAFVFCTACGTKTDTTTVRTANGEVTTTLNKGPYSEDTKTVINTRSGYSDCMSMQAPAMGSANADAYCRNITAGITPNNGGYAGYGMGPAYGTQVPFAGYPATAPLILPSNIPPAVLATQVASASHGNAVVEIRSNQAVDDRMKQIEEDNDKIVHAVKLEREKRIAAEEELRKLQEKQANGAKKDPKVTKPAKKDTKPAAQTTGTALPDDPDAHQINANVSADNMSHAPLDTNP
jgi:hypothetical protein